MKVEIKELENNQSLLTIEVPEEIVTKKIEDAYRQINKSTNLKGFRSGKIPKEILRTYFWKNVKARVYNDLVPEYLQKGIEEAGLQTVGQPKFEESFQLEENAPFSFGVVVTLWPKIDLPADYKENKVPKQNISFTEEQVMDVLKQLQQQQAKYQVVDNRSVQISDQVVVDYTILDIDKQMVVETKQDVVIDIEENKLIPVLFNNLIGMNKGQTKEFEEIFGEKFFDQDLAGKKIQFSINIKEIKEKILPEIDEDFAKDVGDYTLTSLKARIAENIKRELEKEGRVKTENSIVTRLLERTLINPPEPMIEAEIENMLHEIENQMTAQGKVFNNTEENIKNMKEGLRPSAIANTKYSLLLCEVACREGIQVSQQEIDDQIHFMAAKYKHSEENVRKVYGILLEKRLREQKTLDFLVKHATISDN